MIGRLIIKEECRPCKGMGEWFTGNGNGHTAKCSYCQGKGYIEKKAEVVND